MTLLMNRRKFLKHCGCCAVVCASSLMLPDVLLRSSSYGAALKKGSIGKKLSPYFVPLKDQAIQCTLCPHECEVEAGERGICGVRENTGGKYYSLVYGNPCAVNIDPIEKKPFYHVLPTTRSFSIATAGCNLDCKFCQNWEISQARPEETYNYTLSSEQIVSSAMQYECASIASTYVEPTIFIEYMIDIGKLTRHYPLLKVMHSNGFINETPLDDLCKVLDAACIDLKGFTEEYYRDMTEGHLQPVLHTIKRLRKNGVHTELVNLVVPGKNDQMDQVKAMCQWIYKELGPDVPLHFSRFYPQYKLKSVQPTSIAVLEKVHEVAIKGGLNYVYLGNIPEHPSAHTYCPKCKKMLIKRVGYTTTVEGLKEGRCQYCGQPIPGIWKQRKPAAL